MLVDDSREQVDGFDAVYNDQRLAITRLAYLLVRSQPVAEDLAQDAFLRLYSRFSDVENPPGFLRTVVVRLALTWRNRQEMERMRVAQLPRPVDAHVADPDDTWQAIGCLRPERAAVLVLRFYQDLSNREIAHILDCPEATVRSRTRRALADLRKELER